MALAHTRFKGMGVKLIFARPAAISDVRVSIDGTVVNGVNTLDAVTGDKGHTDWTDLVRNPANGIVPLAMTDELEPGVRVWFYSNGVHPRLGKNPCVFTICNRLTYGQHTATVEHITGEVHIEGFMTIAKSVEESQHEFDSRKDISGITSTETLADLVNDVVAIGDMTGAAGEYIKSRAVDLASISDPNAPNYIGVRQPWFFSSPGLNNQERADFLAQYCIMRYRRGRRNPVLETTGLPWIEPDDCLTIRDTELGFYSPGDLTREERTSSGILPVPYGRYWVRSVNERFAAGEDSAIYTSQIVATNMLPQPAYEPLPEPSRSDFIHAISAVNIVIDGGANVYNPFVEDAYGQFVNIDFGLTWHARRLTVRVVAANSIGLDDKPDIAAGQVINVLMSRTGFIPAGEYQCKWDGWMATDDQGNGYYAPDGDYCVVFETERYANAEAFYYRSDSRLPGVMVDTSKEYVTVVQDRDSVYGADPFTVTVTPTGVNTDPPVVYDAETNTGRGLKIEISLACPAKVLIMPACLHVHHAAEEPPSSISEGKFPSNRAELHFRGDETPILEAGDYTFYFNPRVATTFARQSIAFNLLPDGVTTATAQSPHWVSWFYSLNDKIRFVDKAGNAEIVDPACHHFLWGGAREDQYQMSEVINDAFYYYRFFRIK